MTPHYRAHGNSAPPSYTSQINAFVFKMSYMWDPTQKSADHTDCSISLVYHEDLWGLPRSDT